MIKASFIRESGTYIMAASHIGVGDRDVIVFKFDTGAVATVIGIRTLFGDITTERENMVKDHKIPILSSF